MRDLTDRHPGTQQIARWFNFRHPAGLPRGISRSFEEHADWLIDELPDSPELTTALRKLLESKDCAVRAAILAVNDEVAF